MEKSVSKQIKGIFNRISDKINQGKYDRSCVNLALLQDSEEEKKKEQETLKKFEGQIKEYNKSKEDDFDLQLDFNEPTEITKDITNEVKPSNENKDDELFLVEINECYYTIILHKKIYPNPNGKVLYRACDGQRIWVSDGNNNVPQYTKCPNCGKKVTYLFSKID